MFQRPDDPRLGECIEYWQGDLAALRPGRAALIGFPQDEGVRRNHGRPGAAEAPHEIRQQLGRLVPWDAISGVDLTEHPPLDLGDVVVEGSLEETQAALGEVVGAVLRSGAVPIVLGGGHETAYGHYLGYVAAQRPVAIVNLDAHLDVRPAPEGKGHSGSSFRQAMEHPTHPLPGSCYACLGAQPPSVSRQHLEYVRERGGIVAWCEEVRSDPARALVDTIGRLASERSVYVTLDADVVCAADVPAVSAPNVTGLAGRDVIACARAAGQAKAVSSFDLVEINCRFDSGAHSVRWAALAVWNFLVGLASRSPGA